jgi:hypothetical protein
MTTAPMGVTTHNYHQYFQAPSAAARARANEIVGYSRSGRKEGPQAAPLSCCRPKGSPSLLARLESSEYDFKDPSLHHGGARRDGEGYRAGQDV